MNRREFIRHIALLAAGTAALPEQIAAFERYYTINAPQTAKLLLGLDEVCISGLATRSLPLNVKILRGDQPLLNLAINAFGGIMRWVAASDQKILAPDGDLRWEIASVVYAPPEAAWPPEPNDPFPNQTQNNDWLERQFTGYLSYIKQTGERAYLPLNKVRGRLEI